MQANQKYYRAYLSLSVEEQENLLFVDDLAKYEADQVDEWGRLFLIMKERISDYGDQITAVVLYGYNGKTRVLPLKPGAVNIITGMSKQRGIVFVLTVYCERTACQVL